MLATIISDKFSDGERKVIAEALDDICSPDDNWGWASTGVYCFWDSRTSEILYIGLAVDLARRFREHTGLISCKPAGCKKEQIDNFFHMNPNTPLGYSVFLQSCLEQAGKSALSMLIPELGDTGTEDMKAAEGLLIEAHKLSRSGIPAWNKIGGNQQAAKTANLDHEPILNFLSEVDKDCPFRTELSLRELSDDANVLWVRDEVELHLIRMLALNFNGNLKEALKMHQSMQRSNPYSGETLNGPNCQKWIQRWCR